jgi:hypothetical protein
MGLYLAARHLGKSLQEATRFTQTDFDALDKPSLLSVSLMLFAMRNIVRMRSWSDKLLKWCFIGLNGGLAGMTVLSLIPSGFYQFYYAVKNGLWYARSPEIASGPAISAFAWARIAPDVVFATGAILLLVFVGRAIWLTFVKKVPVIEGDRHWQPPDQKEAL